MPVIINGSTGVSGTDGSAGTPALQGTDANTGMFFPAADQIAFAEGGVEAMRLDASGNVGIGTTTPGERLQVSGGNFGVLGATGSSFTGIVNQNNGASGSAYRGLFYDARNENGVAVANMLVDVNADGSSAWSWSTTPAGSRASDRRVDRARITSAGDLLVGTTSANGRLTVAQTSGTAAIHIQNASDPARGASLVVTGTGGAGTVALNTTSSIYALTFGIDSVERARINSSHQFLIGTATAFGGGGVGQNRLQVESDGTPLFLRHSTAGGGNFWRVGPDGSGNNFVVYNQNGNGAYIANNGSSWIGASDERLKTDLKPIESAAQKVSTLRAVTGRFKADEPGTSRAFLIAQDVQAVLPEAVSVQDDEQGTLGLAYTDVIPLLTAALQEALTEIAALKARVAALEATP